jgi:hypothetical protein
MSYTLSIAEKIIKDALSADPRTRHMRVARDKNQIRLIEEADSETIACTTQEDVSSGNAPPGTRIGIRWNPGWEGRVVEAKQTRYVVERTKTASGRGKPGKNFVVPFTDAVLL